MSVVWKIVIIVAVAVLVVWLVFGINWRGMRNYKRRHQILSNRLSDPVNKPIIDKLFDSNGSEAVRPHWRGLEALLATHGRPRVSTATHEIITHGARKYELLVKDLMGAKESIHMEYFHFGIDKGSRTIRKLLMDKAREGVKVRFINENIANFPIPNIYFHAMKRAGVEVVNFTNTGLSLLRFLMTLSYRDHRKIVVIDNAIGYTGGMNINDHYFKQWRDTHLRLEGAAVGQLQMAFIDTWLTAGGKLGEDLTGFFPELPTQGVLTQITPDEPTSPEAVLLQSYEWVLHHAERYVWIQSPYLAPPASLIAAMRAATRRGVEVRVMLPRVCDTGIMRVINPSYYGDMLAAGVELYLRNGEFIHSKTIVADDYLTCIGTTNLDYRSFGIDFEINTYMYDEATALEQKQIYEAELAISDRVTQADIDAVPWVRKMWHRFGRCFSAVV